jgi:hypothetical protein
MSNYLTSFIGMVDGFIYWILGCTQCHKTTRKEEPEFATYQPQQSMVWNKAIEMGNR